MLVVVGVLLSASIAQADRIAPPPTECPAGARGASSHVGPRCEPAECGDEADCAPGEVCRDGSLCAEDRTGIGGRGRMAVAYRVVHGPCDASCTAPRTCVRGRFCFPRGSSPVPEPTPAPEPAPEATPPVPPPVAPPAPALSPAASSAHGDDDGCAVGSSSHLGSLLGVLLGVALVALAARRARARRR